MNQRYVEARDAALGLAEGSPLPSARSYESARIGQRAQASSELFSKTFDTPPEIIVRKSVLSLFEEYEADYGVAHQRLETAQKLLRAGQDAPLRAFLRENRPVEWLNCIFLEDDDIDGFAVMLEGIDDAPRAVLLESISGELRQLVNFKGLYEALLKKWKMPAPREGEADV